MPQLDVFAYNHQLFWFLLFMVVSYLILGYYVLPQIFLILFIKKNLSFLLFTGKYTFKYRGKIASSTNNFTYLVEFVKYTYFRVWLIWLNYFSLNFALNKFNFFSFLNYDSDLIKIYFDFNFLRASKWFLNSKIILINYQNQLIKNLLK